jgi:pyroglutamyl-peptidase
MAIDVDRRPTVLLTGFGPFPGVPLNASGLLVRKLAPLARRQYPHNRFVAAVLPTEWRRAPVRVAKLHLRCAPILALHFGVASGARDIRLEALAQNACRPSRDAAELLPLASSLAAGGPDSRRATIDVPAIARALSARDIPCSVSEDAGGYLCNAVLYQSLAASGADCKVGFVHIPTELSEAPLDLNRAVEAALIIIASSLETN